MSQKVTLVTLTNYGKVRFSAVGSDYNEGSNPPLATNVGKRSKVVSLFLYLKLY